MKKCIGFFCKITVERDNYVFLKPFYNYHVKSLFLLLPMKIFLLFVNWEGSFVIYAAVAYLYLVVYNAVAVWVGVSLILVYIKIIK